MFSLFTAPSFAPGTTPILVAETGLNLAEIWFWPLLAVLAGILIIRAHESGSADHDREAADVY